MEKSLEKNGKEESKNWATVGLYDYTVVERDSKVFYIREDMADNVCSTTDSEQILFEMSDYVFDTVEGSPIGEKVLIKSITETIYEHDS
jgi:hypothetical protein